MINPTETKDIILFNRTQNELEEFILFCICVAGKNAVTSAKSLEKFLTPAWDNSLSPFQYVNSLNDEQLINNIKKAGLGCYNHRAKSFRDIIASGLDLQKCSVQDLENIYGIGPKTARFFILFSRENSNVAVLDTHILKYLKSIGYDVPPQTPSGKKYLEIEQIFLNEAKKQNLSIVEFDLNIWKEMRA